MRDDLKVPVAAFLSSLVSTTVGYPIDSVKSRLQTFPYNGALDCVRKTLHHEGAKAFFRGLSVPLTSATIMRTLSFTTFRDAAGHYTRLFNLPKESMLVNFAGGLTSGLVVSVFACPFELTKLASQLDQLLTPGSVRARTPFQSVGLIWSRHGTLGFWTGFKWHALRDGFGTGIFFTNYYLARDALQKVSGSEKSQSWHHAVSGAFAGSSAWTLVYPLDTLKAVQQKNVLSQSKNFKLNPRQMYKGAGISLLRSALINSINFVILEQCLRLFGPVAEPENAG